MPLPQADRVIYKSNPLDPVICQVRFQPILEITAEDPAAFQKSIRRKFPKYEQVQPQGVQFDLPAGIPPEVSQLLSRTLGPPTHRFMSKNEMRSFTLSQVSLAYADRSYEQWEDFKSILLPAIDTLQSIYEPETFDRIGLRYVNKVKRSDLGLQDVPWSELLEPTVLGAISDEGFGSQVTATTGQFTSDVDGVENATVKVRYGLVQNQDNVDDEQIFRIDIDFGAVGEIPYGEHEGILDIFNTHVRGLFHWSIQERLHLAMEPR